MSKRNIYIGIGIILVLGILYWSSDKTLTITRTIDDIEESILAQTALRQYGNIDVSKVTSVYDGDTFNADINEWPPIIGKNIGVRINGIDTPERTATNNKVRRLSQAAKTELDRILRSATKIELLNLHRDKYFRLNADIFADEEDVGQKLIVLGLAKPYDGGQKPTWTSADHDHYFRGVRP